MRYDTNHQEREYQEYIDLTVEKIKNQDGFIFRLRVTANFEKEKKVNL